MSDQSLYSRGRALPTSSCLSTTLLWVILHSKNTAMRVLYACTWCIKVKSVNAGILSRRCTLQTASLLWRGFGYVSSFVVDGRVGSCCGGGYIYFGKPSYWPLGTVCWEHNQLYWKNKPTHEPCLMILLHAMLWKQYCYCSTSHVCRITTPLHINTVYRWIVWSSGLRLQWVSEREQTGKVVFFLSAPPRPNQAGLPKALLCSLGGGCENYGPGATVWGPQV